MANAEAVSALRSYLADLEADLAKSFGDYAKNALFDESVKPSAFMAYGELTLVKDVLRTLEILLKD
jgi:hypothetical protein